LQTALPIRLTDGWHGEVLNMSATGLRVRTVLLLHPGQPFEGVLEHGGREIAVQGFVIWADPPEFDLDRPGEAGIALVDVSHDYFALLAELFAG
jgi:hypothetical protein